ncbi:calcium-translocating P-type ATPase, SERCA-type [Candidatus Woesearchaeota archaeon]|nr:calcium-translocating P-type ATPase, SERCA-type [Candidatus Woesearchaeota archaeon]
MEKEWYQLPLEKVFDKVASSKEGLSQSQAKERLQKFGKNALEREKKISPFVIFLHQFTSPLVWILLAAMGISLFLQEFIDFYVITIVVIANALFGFWQEYKAEESIEALRKMVSPKAIVIRDGRRREIPAEEVVKGDIIVLETGNIVPADARLIDAVNVQTQEAALTGESVPVKKDVKRIADRLSIGDQKNMVFSGTTVTAGHGKAVVTSTGMRTEIGKIATMLKKTKSEPTPIQKDLKKLAYQLTAAVVLIAMVMIGVDVLLGKNLLEVFEKAVALAVAAIPEGLPAVVTIAFALGVQRMAKKKALMRKLPSVETLGACTVICTDKTGTLTHNEMTVKKLYVDGQVVQVTGSGYEPKGDFSKETSSLDTLLRAGVLNNNAQLDVEQGRHSIVGDPTEGALLVSAAKSGIDLDKVRSDNTRVDEIDFSSERKCMTTIHSTFEGKKTAYTKGAPEVVLGFCTHMLVDGKVRRLTKEDRDHILETNDEFTSQALRVLGFCYKEFKDELSHDDIEKSMIFIGLQGMIDPPREEVKKAIKTCNAAGIKVVMITGDHLGTAKAIGKQIGLEGRAIEGVELESINLSRDVEKISIYARVNPEDKLHIVDALRKNRHIVAMTGDGANDAPALKKADLGIAMGITGTDVSRQASDMILADDNFATIVRAVEEGRVIYDNIKKFVIYLLSSNVGEILTIFVATLLGLIDPLTARQILWINLATDLLPATSLSVDPKEPGVMERKPRDIDEKIVNKSRAGLMLFIGLLMMAGTLFVFEWYEPEVNKTYAQTMAFTTLVLFQLFNVLNQRSETKSIFTVGLWSNKWLIGAVLLSFGLQIASVHLGIFNTLFETIPLSFMDWMIAAAVASSVLIFGEIVKLFRKY